MSCNPLTAGYNLPSCLLDNVGGVQRVYFCAWSSTTVFNTQTDGTITGTTSPSSLTFYKFDIPVVTELSEAKDEPKPNTTNLTAFWDSTVNFVISKPSAALRSQVDSLTKGVWWIVVLDGNGNYKIYGKTKGMYPAPGSLSTGKKADDASMYNLTFVGKEPSEATFITSSAFTSTY